MELVWLRHGDEVCSFPVLENKVMVNAIAEFWKLDQASVRMGKQHALVRDSSGNSVMAIQDIRELAKSSGLGDGLSSDTAIEITAASKKHFLTASKAEAAGSSSSSAAWDRIKRRCKLLRETPGEERNGMRSVHRDSVTHSVFYDGGVHSYAKGMGYLSKGGCLGSMDFPANVKEEFEKEASAKFKLVVATVHALAPGDEQVDEENTVGLATVYKPDGTCLTAQECVKDITARKKRIVVCFRNQEPESVTYECKVSDLGAWALLEPVIPRTSKHCVVLARGIPGPCDAVFSFAMKSRFQLELVRTRAIDRTDDSSTLVPTSRMNMLGAPVMNVYGDLTGIVASLKDIKRGKTFQLPSLMNNKCCGEKDLVALVKSIKGTAQQADLSAGLELKQLVHCTWTKEKKKLVDLRFEWQRQHPLKEFPSKTLSTEELEELKRSYREASCRVGAVQGRAGPGTQAMHA